MSRPETFHHYTTAAGMLGIVGTASLWATDLHFLNDAQELMYGQEHVVDSIRNIPNPVRDPGHWIHEHNPTAVEPATETWEQYRRYVIELVTTGGHGVYVACFCEAGDLLSQWRAYGSDHGYAIEVRADALEEAIAQLPSSGFGRGLSQVRYGTEAAEDVVARAIESVSDFNLNHPGVKASFKALELVSMLATIKHPGFSEEREWRLFASFDAFQQTPYPDAPVTKFRSTPIAIVPYIELGLATDAIVSITVGPGRSADVREAGVRRLLKSVESEAMVIRSDLPLRT